MLIAAEMVLLDLEKRLQYSALPIREWLVEISCTPQFLQLPFLQVVLRMLSDTDLETAWQHALETAKPFSQEDVGILKLLGTHLGKSDTHTQLQCIRETVQRLSANKKQAAETAEKARKLYVGLGTCMGMAVALLLV